MFERFTKDARTTVVDAQEVARQTGSRAIDTRHLLVVLLERTGPASRAVADVGADVRAVASGARADLRSDGLDADALAGIGIDLEAVRRQADEVFGAGALERAGRTPGGHIPFSRDGKKALELALRETTRLKQRTIRAEHLLLGIVRAECPGRTLLKQACIDLEALRRALEERSQAA